MKKITVLLAILSIFVATVSANTNKEVNESGKKTVVLWGFSQSDLEPVEKAYEEMYPDVDIKLVIKTAGDYPNLLKQVLKDGTDPDSPDVFVTDIVYTKQFINSKFSEDLSALEKSADNAGMFEYIKDIGRDSSGILKGLSWQSTVGGFYYRRSLAKKYFGTDDPDQVYEAISNLQKFKEEAARISEESNGTVSMISSVNELQYAFLYSRKSSWIVDGKLNIDQNVYDLFTTSKEFYDNKYLARVPKLYSAEWYSTMRDNYKLDNKNHYVLGYIMPAWALSNHIAPNAKPADGNGIDTTGDWAITRAPLDYIRGGSWLIVNSESKVKEEAKKFIETVTTNVDFLVPVMKEKGGFSSSAVVNALIGGDYSNDFLGGQNQFDVFNALAKNVDGRNLVSPYDKELNTLLAGKLSQYVNGSKSLEDCISEFKAEVDSQFGEVIEVE